LLSGKFHKGLLDLWILPVQPQTQLLLEPTGAGTIQALGKFRSGRFVHGDPLLLLLAHPP
jgi:hypothetical protein